MIVYDEPRVALQPGSTPTVQAPVAHNYAGEQMQQGGAALTKAGAAVPAARSCSGVKPAPNRPSSSSDEMPRLRVFPKSVP